jgi:hypothetical protein
MAYGTGAREQELQRAILTTHPLTPPPKKNKNKNKNKFGYLIIVIKNVSTF